MPAQTLIYNNSRNTVKDDLTNLQVEETQEAKLCMTSHIPYPPWNICDKDNKIPHRTMVTVEPSAP